MAAGQEIVTYCSSCKLNLAHRIVAHKSGNTGPIAKVECQTCKKTHAFRNPPGTKTTKPKAPRAKKEVIACVDEWKKQLADAQSKASKPYNFKMQFDKGDLIDHKKFGLGIVQQQIDLQKIEVLFQNDMKILVHNRS